MLTWETERWAEALAVHRLYGANAEAHIEERIRDLMTKGATAGVARFREIAACLELLREPGAST